MSMITTVAAATGPDGCALDGQGDCRWDFLFLPIIHASPLVEALTIPLFTAVIGAVTNWTGVWMLFNPLEFKGWRIPGLAALVSIMPRRIQQVPGLMDGGIGWQGIIPSRAAKMGSIAVDKGLAKLGNASDFYEELQPEQIAEHIVATADKDIHAMVDRIMEREHPGLWQNLPNWMRATVHSRVQAQLPELVHDVTRALGENIDQLLDVKAMVVRHLERNPELCNDIFRRVGEKELRFLVYFGFWFGGACGIPLIGLLYLLHDVGGGWWVLPIGGAIIGYLTNWLALWMIFYPHEPTRVGPFLLHGLFLRRKSEVARIYSSMIAEEVITLRNLGEELLYGPRAHRTRQTIERVLRPAVDRAAGPVRAAVRVAVGSREYLAIQRSMAAEAVDETVTPLSDPVFHAQQSGRIQKLIDDRMQTMSYGDTAELLHSAIKEDEWLLILHGAVLGVGAGLLHLAIFGVLSELPF
ncbi:MAG: hypothetical protein AB7G37_09090 [Solirubrobacteraceae bacterium]